MDLWLSITLFSISQLIFGWYCGQLAKDKGYQASTFILTGVIPVVSVAALLFILLLPDKKLHEHERYFRKYNQRP